MDSLRTHRYANAHYLASHDAGNSPRAAAAAVRDLERLAGLLPGSSDDEEVVLGRRFSRARRLLLAQPPGEHAFARIRMHLQVLRGHQAGAESQEGTAKADRRDAMRNAGDLGANHLATAHHDPRYDAPQRPSPPSPPQALSG